MRYFPHTEIEIKEMLGTIGVNNISDLFNCIPDNLKDTSKLNIQKGLSEPELVKHLKHLSNKNISSDKAISFLGAGLYRHYVPAAVTELASRAEFVTPYTPYQPEISQGTLQAMFEYQTMMCNLFAMDVSNASNYDAATSLPEAILMAKRALRKKNTVCIPDNIHPEYIEVTKTVLGKKNENLKIIPSENGIFNRSALKDLLNDDLAAVVVQYPNFFGIVEDFQDIAELTHNAGGILIAVVPEPISLGILNPPGNWGADIAIGEGISLGMSNNFGGPTLGIFTAKQSLLRNMPGRICGRTTDSNGKEGYVLTMSTREQHIRREKATSNICSNQALCATTAAIYLSLLGENGLKELAQINLSKSEYAKEKLEEIDGVKIKFNKSTFNEFVIEMTKPANIVLDKLLKENIFGGINLSNFYKNFDNCLLISITELNSKEEIDLLANHLTKILKK